jgi:hypothetical protein
MKKLYTILAAALFVVTIFGQAPDKFNYQAVLRDASGNVKANTSVNIEISILQGSATGTAVYTETQAATTNTFGLVNLQIGGGTATLGSFSSFDWASGPYFVKISVDGTEFGTSQLISVPYAKYAEKAGNGFSGSYTDLTNKPTLFDGAWSSLTGKPTFATVATSGSYSDLTNKPVFTKWDKDSTDNVTITGNQTIAGNKTFSGTVQADSLSLTKKTTKWVIHPNSLQPHPSATTITITHSEYVSDIQTSTAGTQAVPYQMLGCKQKIKSLTVNYQCASTSVYITDLFFRRASKGSLTFIANDNTDLTSTTIASYTLTPMSSSAAIFDDSCVYLVVNITFTGTGAANKLILYEFVLVTE